MADVIKHCKNFGKNRIRTIQRQLPKAKLTILTNKQFKAKKLYVFTSKLRINIEIKIFYVKKIPERFLSNIYIIYLFLFNVPLFKY